MAIEKNGRTYYMSVNYNWFIIPRIATCLQLKKYEEPNIKSRI